MAVAAGITLFTSKDIGTYEVFSGEQKDFDAWIIGFEAEAANRNMWQYVDYVRGHVTEDVGPFAGLGPVAGDVASSLYALFARRFKGRALTFVHLAERGHGFAVLQMIYREYKPRVD